MYLTTILVCKCATTYKNLSTDNLQYSVFISTPSMRCIVIYQTLCYMIVGSTLYHQIIKTLSRATSKFEHKRILTLHLLLIRLCIGNSSVTEVVLCLESAEKAKQKGKMGTTIYA